jgi:hypothetical protein
LCIAFDFSSLIHDQGSLEFMTECTTIEYPFELFDPQKNKSEIGWVKFAFYAVRHVEEESFKKFLAFLGWLETVCWSALSTIFPHSCLGRLQIILGSCCCRGYQKWYAFMLYKTGHILATGLTLNPGLGAFSTHSTANVFFQVASNTSTPFENQTHFSDTVRNVRSLYSFASFCFTYQVRILTVRSFGRLWSHRMAISPQITSILTS